LEVITVRYASYLSPEWGNFAQYCRAQAGYYRNFPRRVRRELEIAAHQAGVQQIPRMILMMKVSEGEAAWAPNEGRIRQILIEAAE